MKIKFFERVKRYYAKRSSKSYIKYLRKKGIVIGEETYIHDPHSFYIDLQRAHMITIGSNVKFNLNNHLICHDGSGKVFRLKFNDYLPSNGHITIGNNVWFGRNVTVLKGVTIGDNCIIGLGSTVMRDVPPNSVVAGTPAKVICSIEDYYAKRQVAALEEIFEFARAIVDRYHRRPRPSDFQEGFVYFVSGKDVDKYPEIRIKHQLGPIFEYYKEHHVAKFDSFDAFLKAAGIE